MKHLFRAFAIGMGLALATFPSVAEPPGGVSTQQDMLQRMTPAEIADFIQKEGYRAEVVTISNKPYVKFKLNGVTAFVELYGCEGGSCTSFRFLLTSKIKNIDINFANEWNNKYRYTKMYIDKDGDFWLDLDVRLTGGMAAANLRGYLQIFDGAIGNLRK